MHLEQFLLSLTEFKTPVECIGDLPEHKKVGGRSSWTEAEMESELLYLVQLYIAHLLVWLFDLHSLPCPYYSSDMQPDRETWRISTWQTGPR